MSRKQRLITTRELAMRFGVMPDTIRRNLCVNKSFLGLTPLKLSNTRLLWPDVYPEDLAEMEGK